MDFSWIEDAVKIMDVINGRSQYAFLNTDGFKLASMMPRDFLDHHIGDPPYDVKTHVGARTMKNGGGSLGIDFPALENLNFVTDYLRVFRRWVLCFCTQEMARDYQVATRDDYLERESGDRNYRRALWWVRTNGCPNLSGDGPGVPGETIVAMHTHRAVRRWNAGGMNGQYIGPIATDHEHRGHTTQKPLWVFERLIEDFTDPGEIVADFTAGVATSMVAAIKLGRRAIGCEIKGPCPQCGGGAKVINKNLVAFPCEKHGWRDYHTVGLERLRIEAARPKQVIIAGVDVKGSSKKAAQTKLF